MKFISKLLWNSLMEQFSFPDPGLHQNILRNVYSKLIYREYYSKTYSRKYMSKHFPKQNGGVPFISSSIFAFSDSHM